MITITGLTVSQQRRFKAVAKKIGNEAKAARLAMRIGLCILAGDLATAHVATLELELAAREEELDSADLGRDVDEVIEERKRELEAMRELEAKLAQAIGIPAEKMAEIKRDYEAPAPETPPAS